MLRPNTFARPAVGATRPSRSLSSVVFPAPFGPTRPIAPSGIVTLRSSTARTSPNTFVSPAVSTRAMFGPSVLFDFRRRPVGRRLRTSFLSAPPVEEDQERADGHGDDDEQPIDDRQSGRPRSEGIGLELHP